ncbi:BPL-N domain-containing protein [Prosthecobacter sp.]|uniref:BPL-N domain-containing protein n=1 Tax=Prosthecobacter sp. TaxID=1965333 RepID=UPI0037831BB9
MKSSRHLSLLLMLAAFLSPVCAQEKAKPKDEATSKAPKFVTPPDANGMKTIIAAPEKTRPIKVGIYRGPGAPQGGGDNVINVLKPYPQAQVVVLSEKDIATLNLSAYDVLVFPGGSGGGQSKGIGEAGLKNVRDFVKNGGGYVGICGGAYLACSNFSWGLGILNAGTVSSKWMRGQAMLDLQVEPSGTELLGDVKDPFKVRYHNGPILKPAGRTDIPAYTTLTTFKTEVANNGTPAGVQIDSPAHTISSYGKGRVFISSPHPENTPGLENLIPRGIFWAAGEKSSAPIP